MKILFTNGRQPYPLFRGGDGIMIHTLLDYWSKQKHSVLHIGKSNPPEQSFKLGGTLEKLQSLGIDKIDNKDNVIRFTTDKSYDRIMVKNEKYLKYVEHHIKDYASDIVLTQLDESTNIIKICVKLKTKCIFALHDHDALNYQTLNFSHHLSHVVFNSSNTKNHFASVTKCSYSIIYPPIKFSDYKTNKKNSQYITFINPVRNKGAAILDELILAFPEEKFLLVKGWKGLDTKNHLLPNVTVHERIINMKNIYEMTKILLIPSQWEEPFGRVAPEAAVNNIPIVASKIGGLPESVGSGGILIDEFSNPVKWVTELRKLLNSKRLQKKLGDDGYRYCKKFSDEKIFKQWDMLLKPQSTI